MARVDVVRGLVALITKQGLHPGVERPGWLSCSEEQIDR